MNFIPQNAGTTRDEIFSQLKDAAEDYGLDFKVDEARQLGVGFCSRYVDFIYDLQEEHGFGCDDEEFVEARAEFQQGMIDELNSI